MILTEETITRIVKEELEKFLESNPQFKKLMQQHAQSDASKAFAQNNQANDQEDKQAQKDKQFRQAQRGQGGTREIEFE